MEPLISNLSQILKSNKIKEEHIKLIIKPVLKNIKNTHALNQSIEKYIAILIEKYDINHFKLYDLNNRIWNEIINFKFNNPKV